ncbi:hypothetical protein PVK06_046960 [Gossypium arboreum]|uniref:Uncharacterized protein n=1 Tax=Gossypium arboreum TaxID=29729 RepID=A0ABR0MCG3_GOSAR|nr:hypothetical protein PVK06_046960 [Gossypium arboreum]
MSKLFYVFPISFNPLKFQHMELVDKEELGAMHITFQTPASVDFTSSSNHSVISRSGLVIITSSIIVAISVTTHQFLHLTGYLFHPVLWTIVLPSLIRQSVPYFIGFSLYVIKPYASNSARFSFNFLDVTLDK